LVATVGRVALVVLGVSGAVAGIGAAILGASFFVGLMGSAFATLAAVIGFVFSPLGVAVGLLMAAAAGAWAFRDSIKKAMGDVAGYFKAPIESLKNLYGIFRSTFNGILAALQSGDINTASKIMWLGFKAAAWEAVVGVGNAILTMVRAIEGLVPATAGVANYMLAAFNGIGQALIAGNWGLAAEIAMAKVGVAVLQGWASVSNTWDNFIATLGISWDIMLFHIKDSFRAAVESISQGFQKLVGIAGRVVETIAQLRNPGEMALELAFPQLDFQAFRQQVAEGIAGSLAVPISNFKGNAKSLADAFTPTTAEQDRNAFLQSNAKRNAELEAARKRREQEVAQSRQGIAAMEAQANRKNANGQTFQGKADLAREALQRALDDARKEQAARAAMGAKAAQGPQALAGAALNSTVGGRNGGPTGTFSAIASALGNRTGANAAESTAKNTGLLVRLATHPLSNSILTLAISGVSLITATPFAEIWFTLLFTRWRMISIS
jgi:hypothetical protein